MDRTIRKLFGTGMLTAQAPIFLSVDWYIGPSRAQELIDCALAALLDRARDLMEEAINTPEHEWLKIKLVEAQNLLRDTIMIWQDEELGPKTEEGTPLSATGTGAKKRYEAYILSWVDEIISGLDTEFRQRIAGKAGIGEMPLGLPGIAGTEEEPTFGFGFLGRVPEKLKGELKTKPRVDWVQQWGWLEQGMKQAEAEARQLLPASVMGKIDFAQLWNDVINEADLTQLRPSTCACELKNGLLVKVLQTQRDRLTPGEVLNLMSQVLTCMIKEDIGKPWWEWQRP